MNLISIFFSFVTTSHRDRKETEKNEFKILHGTPPDTAERKVNPLLLLSTRQFVICLVYISVAQKWPAVRTKHKAQRHTFGRKRK